MLQDILIERKVYASEEHKMMKGMIQEFISNEIMDHIDEWEKKHGESRNRNEQVNWDCCVSICLKYMVAED
jgi:hypothetical protein